MYTMVNGCLSSKLTIINRSVPQGSILGPLLFLIFINDLPQSNNLLNFLFADDTTAVTSGTDMVEIGNRVNFELQKIGNWLKANELSINPSKTKIMVFSNSTKASNSDFRFFLNLNDFEGPQEPSLITTIERISNNSDIPTVKLLGVYLDENLNFNYHCSKVCKKISSSLFAINKVKNVLSVNALKKLYFALVHPHFLYCLPIYSCTSSQNLKMLELKQKQSIRIVTKSKYNAHTEPLFFEHKILPFMDLVYQQKLLIMHSIYYNYSNTSYEFQLNNRTTHNFELRSSDDFTIPRSYRYVLDKMPLFDFPRAWNLCNPDFKGITDRIEFKTILKYGLLDRVDNFSCNRLICRSCMTIN